MDREMGISVDANIDDVMDSFNTLLDFLEGIEDRIINIVFDVNSEPLTESIEQLEELTNSSNFVEVSYTEDALNYINELQSSVVDLVSGIYSVDITVDINDANINLDSIQNAVDSFVESVSINVTIQDQASDELNVIYDLLVDIDNFVAYPLVIVDTSELDNIVVELEEISSMDITPTIDTSGIDSVVSGSGEMNNNFQSASTSGGEVSRAVALIGTAWAAHSVEAKVFEFDKWISRAAELTGATAEETAKLTEQSRELFTASLPISKIAEAQQLVATATGDANNALEIMPGVMNLVKVSGSDLNSTATAGVNIFEKFGISATETADMLTYMAAASTQMTMTGDQMTKTLERVSTQLVQMGMTGEEAVNMLWAFDKSGLNNREIMMAMRGGFTTLIQGWSEGSKGLAKIEGGLQKLGITTRDANGQLRPLNDVVIDAADKLSQMENGTTKTQLAVDIFGKSAMRTFAVLSKSPKDAASAFGNNAEQIVTDVRKINAEHMTFQQRIQKLYDWFVSLIPMWAAEWGAMALLAVGAFYALSPGISGAFKAATIAVESGQAGMSSQLIAGTGKMLSGWYATLVGYLTAAATSIDTFIAGMIASFQTGGVAGAWNYIVNTIRSGTSGIISSLGNAVRGIATGISNMITGMKAGEFGATIQLISGRLLGLSAAQTTMATRTAIASGAITADTIATKLNSGAKLSAIEKQALYKLSIHGSTVGMVNNTIATNANNTAQKGLISGLITNITTRYKAASAAIAQAYAEGGLSAVYTLLTGTLMGYLDTLWTSITTRISSAASAVAESFAIGGLAGVYGLATGAVTSFTSAVWASMMTNPVGWILGIIAAVALLVTAIASATGQFHSLDDSIKEGEEALDSIDKKVQGYRDGVKEANEQVSYWEERVKNAKPGTEEYAIAVDKLKKSKENVTKATENAKDAEDQYMEVSVEHQKVVSEYNDALNRARHARIAYAVATGQMTEAEAKSKIQITDEMAQLQESDSALKDATKSLNDYSTSTEKGTDAIKKADPVTKAYSDKINDTQYHMAKAKSGWDAFGAALRGGLDLMPLQMLINIIKKIIGGLWGESPGIINGLQYIGSLISPVFGGFANIGKGVKDSINGIVSALWGLIFNVLNLPSIIGKGLINLGNVFFKELMNIPKIISQGLIAIYIKFVSGLEFLNILPKDVFLKIKKIGAQILIGILTWLGGITASLDSVRFEFIKGITWLINMPKQAFNWGVDIIKKLANGIISAIPGLEGALEFIAKYLRGKSPTEAGPLSSIDLWGFNVGTTYVQSLADGIASNTSAVETATASVTETATKASPTANSTMHEIGYSLRSNYGSGLRDGQKEVDEANEEGLDKQKENIDKNQELSDEKIEKTEEQKKAEADAIKRQNDRVNEIHEEQFKKEQENNKKIEEEEKKRNDNIKKQHEIMAKWAEHQEWIENIRKGIEDFAGWITGGGKSLLEGGRNALTSGFGDLGKFLGDSLKIDWNGIGSGWSSGWTFLSDGIKGGFDGIVKFFTDLPGRIVGALSLLSPENWPKLGDMVYNWGYQAGQALGMVVVFFRDLPGNVYLALQNFYNYVVGAFNNTLAYLQTLPSQLYDLGQYIWNGLTNGLNSVWSALMNALGQPSKWLNNFITFLTTLPERITKLAQNAWISLANGFNSVTEYVYRSIMNIPNVLNNFVDWLRNLPKTLYNAALNAWNRLARGFWDGVAWIRGAIDNTIKAISDGINWIITLPNRAYEWGRNLIQSWIDGIMSALGGIGAFFDGLGKGFSDYMESHSPPKMGPLSDIDKWGLNIGKTYIDSMSGGISEGVSKLTSALPAIRTALSDVKIESGSLAPSTSEVGTMKEALTSKPTPEQNIEINLTVQVTAGRGTSLEEARETGDAVGVSAIESIKRELARKNIPTFDIG